MTMGLKRWFSIFFNKEAGKVQKHLRKWLSKKKKRKRRVPHMLASRRCYLDYSKVFSHVVERWLLAWNQNKQITY